MPTDSNSMLQRRIDRLVDGESAPDEVRALFDDLDAGGDWRRLALAFVESAALRRSLREHVAASSCDSPSDGPLADAGHALREASGGAARRALPARSAGPLVAATTCLALLVGFVAGRATDAVPIAGRPPMNEPGSRGAPPVHPDSAPRPRDALPAASPAIAHPEMTAANTGTLADDAAAGQTVSVVFTDPQTETSRTVQVPVFDASSVDPRWLTSGESVVPDSVRAALLRLGHEVQVERRLYPVDLGDGRRAVVPIDDVQVQYVGQRAWQ